jgi:hypothetical protein
MNSHTLSSSHHLSDGPPQNFWAFLNKAILDMGFEDLYGKWHFPVWFLYAIAYAANVLGALLGRKFKLSPFNVNMLVIHRYFNIQNAQRDLQYEPVKPTSVAWPETIAWFKANWLPGYLSNKKKD